MGEKSYLDGIAQSLVQMREAMLDIGRENWISTDVLTVIERVGEMAAYLCEADEAVPTGSPDDYIILIGLEGKRDFFVNAEMLVAEISAMVLGDEERATVLVAQRALIQASDKYGQDIAALARAHIDAKGLIN
jgi:hypothetical protein